jgi:hypothetical protein
VLGSEERQKLRLGHFPALLLCLLFMSVIFGCLFETTAKERVLAVIRYFITLALFSIALAWLMYFFTR